MRNARPRFMTRTHEGRRGLLPAALAAAILLGGCASVIEGDYFSSEQHEIGTVTSTQVAEATEDVADIAELREAILEFIGQDIQHAKLRFSSYEGSAEDDLASVCMEIPNETPIGDYAVYYISYNLNKIVSYLEADVTITYKRPASGLDDVPTLRSVTLYDTLLDYISAHQEHALVYVTNAGITAELITDTAESVYYENPESVLYCPEISVTMYPEGEYPCYMELSFNYAYSQRITESRAALCASEIDGIINSLPEELTVEETVTAFAAALCENAAFDYEREADDDYSRWYNSNTAYGALVMKKASGEGFAIAMKLLCDRAGIDCSVIMGRLNNVTHGWNIIMTEDGTYYHIDSTMLADYSTDSDSDDESEFDESAEESLLYNDSELEGLYWWDTGLYPKCDGESLHNYDEEENGDSGNAGTGGGERLPDEPNNNPGGATEPEHSENPDDNPDENGENPGGAAEPENSDSPDDNPDENGDNPDNAAEPENSDSPDDNPDENGDGSGNATEPDNPDENGDPDNTGNSDDTTGGEDNGGGEESGVNP